MPNQLLVDPTDLTRFTAEIFESAGMPREHAEIEADVLVWANLRGVDSHGVLRIPWYVRVTPRNTPVRFMQRTSDTRR